VKIEGFERFFKDIVVPTEDVAEFTKTGKRRVVKRKLYPGYIMVNMHINDETWFLVRETPGIGDFTGSAGKPTPMNPRDVERILHLGKSAEEGDTHVKTAIPFRQGDRVRVKEGYFQNFEGDVESVDEANGRVTVMINIFGRSTPVELEHWQIEAV
jgi:transcriptional antiterminator NusG